MSDKVPINGTCNCFLSKTRAYLFYANLPTMHVFSQTLEGTLLYKENIYF